METKTGFNRSSFEQKQETVNDPDIKKNKEKNVLSSEEIKEKILLELIYLQSEIDSIEDKKLCGNLKKIAKEIQTNTESIFEKSISNKMAKDYIKLKKSEIDLDLLKLIKYI